MHQTTLCVCDERMYNDTPQKTKRRAIVAL